MSLFGSLFGERKRSASKASDRLKIILERERATNSMPYLEDMKRELLEVIRKYTDAEDVRFKPKHDENIDTLEVDIILGKQR